MFVVLQTSEFSQWLLDLRDRTARGLIVKRLTRMAAGNLGDTKQLGDGLSEARIFFGPGYRLYFTRRDETLVVMLCGGDKSSQDRDIERARQFLKEIGNGDGS